MKINNIVEQLALTPAEQEQKSERRDLLKGMGTKLAMAAIPFAAASFFSNNATAQSKETIINRLNYLLKLEYIVEQIYVNGLAATNVIPAAYKPQIDQVVAQNKMHVEALKAMITELGGTVYELAPSAMDLSGGSGSGGGYFKDAFTTTKEFLVLTQFLSDAGTRIYKGQITEVFSDKIVVRVLMTIHSVKARQAAFMRFLRQQLLSNAGLVKPWITGTNSDTDNPATQRGYAGDSLTSQADINIIGLNGYSISTDVASQAFEEPLIQADGQNILNRFIKP